MHYRGASQSALNKNWVFNALLCCTIYPSHSLLALYKNIKYQTEWERGPVDTRHSETLNFQIKILPIFHQLYFCQNKLSLPDTVRLLHSHAPLLCQHSMASRFKLGPELITRREKHSVLTITDLDWFCSVAYNLSLKEQERNGGGGKITVRWKLVGKSWIIWSWRRMSTHNQDWSQACRVMPLFPWRGLHPHTGNNSPVKFWCFPLCAYVKGLYKCTYI